MDDSGHRHYQAGMEQERLSRGAGELERARTQEILERYLPAAPAVILDVGGGPGRYAFWLAHRGHQVHLVDAVPLHIEQARAAEAAEGALASAEVGDARQLQLPDAYADLVLLLGPLYHLTEREDRLACLREARRVLKPQGILIAAGISRFASAIDGLVSGHLDDPAFRPIVDRDLQEGQHRNPTDHPYWFATAYFHHPEEWPADLKIAGLAYLSTLALEGPAWILSDLDSHLQDPERRQRLLGLLRRLESDSSLLGASAHHLAIARRED